MNFSQLLRQMLTICFIAVLAGCSNSDVNNTLTTTDIPALLDRSEKIQLDKEWEFAQNFYAKQLQTLNKEPNNTEAKINLAQLFIKEARVTGEHGHYYPGALKMLNQVVDANPKNLDQLFLALVTKAGVQLSLHEFAAAKETGEKALLLNPSNAQAYGVLVDANVELGNYEAAVFMSDKMVSIKPDIRSYSRVSYLREIHGDIPGAIQAMEMAVKSGYPGYEETAWAMLTLGELYKRYDQPEKALAMYNEILATRPNYPFAIGAIGEFYYDYKNLEKAESHTQEAMDIIPEVGFYVQMAHIYNDRQEMQKRDELMEEVFLMLQDDETNGHNMNLEYADLYLELLNDSDKALAYAQKEYEKRPLNIDVNRLLAKIYQQRNDLEKVAFHTKAASVTNSKHPDLIELKAALATL
jgi:tetratricopeptide (TPR) repeat protein